VELRRIVGGVSDILHMMSVQYDEEHKCVTDPNNTKYKSSRSATMSIFAHLHWITSLCEASTAAFVCSFIYIDRFCTLSKTPVNFSTTKWLTFIALMVSLKYWHDSVHSNQMFSNIGGYDLKELNLMEREFLTTIKYDLHASRDEFDMYMENLRKNISQSPKSAVPCHSSKLDGDNMLMQPLNPVKPAMKPLPANIEMNLSMEYPTVTKGRSDLPCDKFGKCKKLSPSHFKSSPIVNLTSEMMIYSLTDTVTSTFGGCVANPCCVASDNTKEKLSGVIPMAVKITNKLTCGMSSLWSAFSAVFDTKLIERKTVGWGENSMEISNVFI